MAWRLVGASLAALAFSRPANAAEPTPSIRVRVYDYARVERRILAAAEKEAAQILAQAGIATVWVDCPLEAADYEAHPACHQPLTPADIILRFVSSSMEKGLPFDHSKVGFALVSKEGPPGSFASVFYQRILSLARGDESALGLGLGRATTHEIGHLLLRTEEHSKRGIMRGDWRQRDFCDGTAMLLFAREEADRMRANLRSRVALRPAINVASASPRNDWSPTWNGLDPSSPPGCSPLRNWQCPALSLTCLDAGR
ncbi:MAG: hypothetical protein ACE145_09795 [Terriglobia bacterium]